MLDRRTFCQVVIGFLALVLGACQYLGAANAPGSEAPASTAAPTVDGTTALPISDATTTPTGEPPGSTPSPRPPPTPRPDIESRLQAQARDALARWAAVIGDAPPDAIVFTSGLTRGGGWRGNDGGDKKTAFYGGMLEATVPLATEPPPPGEVVWPDGSTSTMALWSASEALADLVGTAEAPGSCDRRACVPLKVIGAKLTRATRDTSHGVARVPVWEFEFAQADVPLDPITHVAVRDRVILGPAEEWDPYGDNPIGPSIDAAYGTRADSELTVAFVGSPCREEPCSADYIAEAIESDLAVVVIVRASRTSTSQGPTILVGAMRTATVTLDRPLGDRTVLEVQFGTPVVVIPEDPPLVTARD